MSGDATGSDGVSDGTVVTLEGVVRKRRSLSRRLAFVDLETDQATSVPLVADGWSLPKSITAGLCVRVKGVWETSEARGRRLALMPDGVIVLRDGRAENAWENASMSAAWRARVREMPADAEGTADLVEGAMMCLSWADLGRCSDPACVARHSASSRWETRRARRERGGVARGTRRARRRRARGPSTAETKPRATGHAAKRSAVFAAWLVDTSVEALRGGEKDEKDEKDTNDENDENASSSAHAIGPASGGVVDIAGGRGLLAFELALEHGVPVTLVDPKPLRLNKKTRRRVRKWRRETFGGTETLGSEDLSRVPVRHVRAAFEGMCQSESRTFGETAASVQDFERDVADVADVAEVTNVAENTKKQTIAAAVRAASALVAMHPDQATDSVFETALALGKPFAVVPCCVFAD